MENTSVCVRLFFGNTIVSSSCNNKKKRDDLERYVTQEVTFIGLCACAPIWK